jgi:transposase
MVAASSPTIHQKAASWMAPVISVLGIDIAKLMCHIVGMDDAGHVVLRKRIACSECSALGPIGPPMRIGMDACGSAHDWARCCREHEYDGWLIAPQFITAYVKSPKNEARDAEAIYAGVTRPKMRFVPIKRGEPQDLQARHRGQERLINACVASLNATRRHGQSRVHSPVVLGSPPLLENDCP